MQTPTFQIIKTLPPPKKYWWEDFALSQIKLAWDKPNEGKFVLAGWKKKLINFTRFFKRVTVPPAGSQHKPWQHWPHFTSGCSTGIFSMVLLSTRFKMNNKTRERAEIWLQVKENGYAIQLFDISEDIAIQWTFIKTYSNSAKREGSRKQHKNAIK